MKKSLITTLAFGLVAGMAMVAQAGTAPGSGIQNTAHDLSTTGRAAYGDALEQAGLDRICVYCHAPHNTIAPGSPAADTIDYLPLWNHEVTIDVYTTYDNGADDPNEMVDTDGDGIADSPGNHALGATIGQPGSVSRLCLSCHDGSVATNSYGNTTGNLDSTGLGDAFINQSTNQFLIGGNLDMTNHHPIGFNYADAQSKDDEIAATTATMGNYTIGDLLWAGNMECTTCHDVHNSKNSGEKFLWVSDANSAFCLTCHLK